MTDHARATPGGPAMTRRHWPRLIRRGRCRGAWPAWRSCWSRLCVAAHPLGNFTINHYAGHPRRAGPGPPRRRHRPGRDPDLPGPPRLRHRRRRRGLRRRDRRRPGRGVRRRSARSLSLTSTGESAAARSLTEAGLHLPGRASAACRRCGWCAASPRRSTRPLGDATRPSRSPTRRYARSARLARDRGRRLGRDARGRAPASLRTTSASARLTAYPADLLTQALDDRGGRRWSRRPAAPTLAPFDDPGRDAAARRRLTWRPQRPTVDRRQRRLRSPAAAPPPVAGAGVPGGVGGGDLPSIFRAADLTPSCCSCRS